VRREKKRPLTGLRRGLAGTETARWRAPRAALLHERGGNGDVRLVAAGRNNARRRAACRDENARAFIPGNRGDWRHRPVPPIRRQRRPIVRLAARLHAREIFRV
jgi:hypothetical protein